jgi:gliding motility-associated-like protein
MDTSFLASLHHSNGNQKTAEEYKEHSYKATFVGASPLLHQGLEPYEHLTNYYNGSRRAENIASFAALEVRNLYPHTDLYIYEKRGRMKYDYMIRPGGSPSSIRLNYEFADSLALEGGDLLIHTSVGTVREKAPFAYQIIEGKLQEVACHYLLHGNEVTFGVAAYQPDHLLTIDPEVIFSSYIGSVARNFGFTACDDVSGNLISGSISFGNGYPVTLGAFQSNFNTGTQNSFDVNITKFNPDGSQLLFSTYLGGNRQETPHSIAVDDNNDIVVMGVTGSSDFPVTTGCYQSFLVGGPPLIMGDFFTSGHPEGCDFFVTKFSAAGSLLNSTYIGGNTNDGLNYADDLFYNYGDAFRGEVNVDENNNIYVASVTKGDFPGVTVPQNLFGGGASDGILFKLNPYLTDLMWATYVGGNNDDACYAVEITENGSLLIAGGTKSPNFPFIANGHDAAHNGGTDGFIALLDPSTQLLLSGTFVGTSGYDQCYFVQTDLAGSIFTLGQSDGPMPITPGTYGQANSGQFIRKFTPDLSAALWTTTIGTGSGEIDISPTAFLVSDCDYIYFSGWGGGTNSSNCGTALTCRAIYSTTNNLPITPDAFQSTTDGSDFYLCLLTPDAGNLLYATYFGGSESDEHVDGGTSRFNKNGSVYQAVCAGCQNNDDFPTTPNAWSNENASVGCNLGVFKFNLTTLESTISLGGPPVLCEDVPTLFENLSTGANAFVWTFGDGGTSTAAEPVYTYSEPGTYTVQLITSDILECLTPDTSLITLEVLPGVNPVVQPVNPVCDGETAFLFAEGSPAAYWLENETLNASSIFAPTATPFETTSYFFVDSNACETDTVEVVVAVYIPPLSASNDAFICIGESTTLNAIAPNSLIFEWLPTIGLTSPNAATTAASPTTTTMYYVLMTTEEGCTATDSVLVSVDNASPGGQIYPDVFMCEGSFVQLVAEPGESWQWSPALSLNDPLIQGPIATPLTTTTYEVYITNGCGFGTSQVTVQVVQPSLEAFGGGTICKGQQIGAWVSGGSQFSWQPANFAFPSFADSASLSPPESMQFVVTGLDQNGCLDEDSVWVFVLPLPPVDAGPDQYFDYPGTVVLYGNTFGLDYTWEPIDFLSCSECSQPTSSADVPIYYTLSTTDHNGCVGKDSVLVYPYFPIWVPNSITPNNDGLNDVFLASGRAVEGFHLQIFNRWGLLVFETRDPAQPWDGGVNAYYAPNDTYIWKIEYDTSERREKLMGHVNVIR